MPKELDAMQKAIKKSLRKKFPKMSEKELETRAWKIANDRWKKMGKGENMDSEIKIEKKYDEDGMEIIAENVPIIFEAGIGVIIE